MFLRFCLTYWHMWTNLLSHFTNCAVCKFAKCEGNWGISVCTSNFGFRWLTILSKDLNKYMSRSHESPYHTPQPGMPTVWMILITTCAMKTKKKAIKLKELSVLHRENNDRQERCDPANDVGPNVEYAEYEWDQLT